MPVPCTELECSRGTASVFGIGCGECGSGSYLTGFSFGYNWKEVGSGTCLRIYADSRSNFFSHSNVGVLPASIKGTYLTFLGSLDNNCSLIKNLAQLVSFARDDDLFKIQVNFAKLRMMANSNPFNEYLFLGYNWVADGCILYVMFLSLSSHIIYSGCVPTLPHWTVPQSLIRNNMQLT